MPLRPPPLARLPPNYRQSRLHPPPFYNNLTRSTLPTASLSPPLPVSPSPQTPSSARLPPIVINNSPPSRSSLDTLRSVQTRWLSTSSTTHIQSSNSNSSWWFFQPSESSSSKEHLLNQDDQSKSQSDIKKKYLSPKNPVVFCHGLLGFDIVKLGPAIAPFEVTHWRGIKEVLQDNGTEVLITRVPATSSPCERAKVLEEKISAVYPGRSVHLIGHSMGGLDCRYLTTHLTNRQFKVLSITTIATPHRGSSFADHFLSTVGPSRMPSVMSLLDLLPNGGGDGKAFECLTVESMKRFNEETPDVEGVKYFSWGAVYDPGLIDTWKWPHSILLEKEGPNDGLVSVESAKWGKYLGTLNQVNHLDLVGWINTARYKWAEITGKEIKFRPASFYLQVVDMLAREVEGLTDEDARNSTDGAQGVEADQKQKKKEVEDDAIGSPKLQWSEDGVLFDAERDANEVPPQSKGKGKLPLFTTEPERIKESDAPQPVDIPQHASSSPSSTAPHQIQTSAPLSSAGSRTETTAHK